MIGLFGLAQSKNVMAVRVLREVGLDETREYLLENLAYSQSIAKFGYVGGVGEVPFSQPRGNLTGDPWFSDGYRLVLWVGKEPVPLPEIQFLDWRRPYE